MKNAKCGSGGGVPLPQHWEGEAQSPYADWQAIASEDLVSKEVDT